MYHLPCSCACHFPGFSKTETKSCTAALQCTQRRKVYFVPILCMEHYFNCTGLSNWFSPNTTLEERLMWRMHIDPSLTRILGQGVKFILVLLGQAPIKSSWQFWLFYQFIYSIHKPLLLMLAISTSELLMLQRIPPQLMGKDKEHYPFHQKATEAQRIGVLSLKINIYRLNMADTYTWPRHPQLLFWEKKKNQHKYF